jgi:phosphate transport system substrate-binding protein
MQALVFAYLIAVALTFSGGSASAEPIHGAGSTFAYPVIGQWSQAQLKDRAGGDDIALMEAGIDYEPVGSIAGILRLSQPDIDFALTDVPLPPEELQKFGYIQFPVVIGGIVPVVNLEGIASGDLKLSGEVLGDIYLGKIRNWSDPAIVALNAGIALPDLKIVVIHRTYDSGSTFHWTSFLSRENPEWKSRYGAATLIDWPVGIAAVRSSGMVQAVKETVGAIGYVEYGQVLRAALAYAAVENRSGQFIRPEPRAFAMTASEAQWSPDNGFFQSPIEAAGAGAYPLTTVTFALLRKEPSSRSRARQTLWFFKFALEDGAAEAETLGYAPLPASLVGQVKVYWERELRFMN